MNGSYKTPIGTRVPLFPLHFLGWLLLLQALSKRLSPTKITSAKRSTFINEKKLVKFTSLVFKLSFISKLTACRINIPSSASSNRNNTTFAF